MKKIMKIETTGDLNLNIQRIECYSTTSAGRKRAQDEVCLMISGYDSEIEQSVETIATISLEEAKKLIRALKTLTRERKTITNIQKSSKY